MIVVAADYRLFGPFGLRTLTQTDARAATVLVDEVDAGGSLTTCVFLASEGVHPQLTCSLRDGKRQTASQKWPEALRKSATGTASISALV